LEAYSTRTNSGSFRRRRTGANEDERQKKEKTRRETTAIKVWVTPAEKAAITVKADAYC
jgi:hypothetical protein